jgi:hypothetical protein
LTTSQIKGNIDKVMEHAPLLEIDNQKKISKQNPNKNLEDILKGFKKEFKTDMKVYDSIKMGRYGEFQKNLDNGSKSYNHGEYTLHIRKIRASKKHGVEGSTVVEVYGKDLKYITT